MYRTVYKTESDYIAVNGFRDIGNHKSKLFATSAQDAANFGRLNYGADGLPFTIKAEVPSSLMSGMYKGEMVL